MNDAPYRATWTHPSFFEVGTLDGEVRHDPFEGQDLFFPDEVHHRPLFDLYGVEAMAGLYLNEGARVVPQ